MGLQQFWFIVVAALFLGFFVLEGFDFGVGMLMEWLGRRSAAPQRAASNRIAAPCSTPSDRCGTATRCG